MNKIIEKYSLLVLILIGALGCEKNLDLAPVSSISNESFWKTEDDALGAVYGMYDRLRNVTATNLFIWGEARSQDLVQSVGNDFSNLRNFTNQMLPEDAGPDWTTLYQVVNDANLIIDHVPGISFTSDENKDRLLAEAFTMRAFCYFVLVRTWGEVPIVSEPTSGFDPNKIYKERSSVQEVFDFIKQDINQALTLFPDFSFQTGRNRWSRAGTYALRGDVYLWTGKVLNGGNDDFTVALKSFDAIIDSSSTRLLDNFDDIFRYDNKGNDEIIMSSNFTRFEGATQNTFMQKMWIDQIPTNARPDVSGVIGVTHDGSYWQLSNASFAAFKSDDQRTAATFYPVYTDDGSGNYTVLFTDVQMKFRGLVDAGTRYFLDDVVLYRLGDILLLKAEAENALGIDPSNEINEVRKRAYGVNFNNHIFTDQGADINDDMILQERLLELFYEGKRWWDILRFNKAAELIPYFIDHPQDTYKYVWPISLDILSKEPKVTPNPWN